MGFYDISVIHKPWGVSLSNLHELLLGWPGGFGVNTSCP